MSAIHPLLAILAAGICAGACAAPRATLERVVMGDPAKPYLGMSKAEVIACAGNPSGNYSHTTGETLIYHYNGAGPVPTAGKEKSESGGGLIGRKKSDKKWACSASLVFEDGRLVRVTFAPREVVSPYATKRDPKTGKKEPVPQPEPCVFAPPNCPRRG